MTLQLIFKRLEIVLDRVKVVRIFPEEIGGVVRPILLQESLVFRTPPAQFNESERQCLTVADQWKVVVTRDEETDQNERVISEHAYKLIVDQNARDIWGHLSGNETSWKGWKGHTTSDGPGAKSP